MAISIFPSTAAEFVSNNFVVDMNDSTNNTADTGGVKQAGPYSMSFSSGDTSFDVYLIDEDGNSVGYSNTTSIVASGLFSTVVILGVAQDEVVSFLYQGSVNNADGEGDEPGAGAYLESISPTDLPTIDDTATVTGGNFASDVEITFESGATVLSAKNIVVNSSTELLITRPDGLVEDDAPYDLKAVNPGVTPPTGSDAHILVNGVTAGSDPTWVTGSELPSGTINQTYVGATLEATDSDGTVVSYTVTAGALPTGLSLDSSTGVISGTPTSGGQAFTVTAEDDGGNTTPKEFTLPVLLATGGSISTRDGFTYHSFESTDDFVALAEIPAAEYIIIAGGGGAGYGGGGAGGLLSGMATIAAGTYTATIGAGGVGSVNVQTNGSDSTLAGIGTATGGGFGGDANSGALAVGDAGSGGSGGGAAKSLSATPGSGIAGQGFAGGNAPKIGNVETSGGGGGAGEVGGDGFQSGNFAVSGSGGDGQQFSDYATATGNGVDGGYYAGGGGGFRTGTNQPDSTGGLGGGGASISASAGSDGLDNTGGGGGGAFDSAGDGGSGLIVVRY